MKKLKNKCLDWEPIIRVNPVHMRGFREKCEMFVEKYKCLDEKKLFTE